MDFTSKNLKKKKQKKHSFVLVSVMIYFFRPVTSKPLLVYELIICLFIWFCLLSFSCLLIL